MYFTKEITIAFIIGLAAGLYNYYAQGSVVEALGCVLAIGSIFSFAFTNGFEKPIKVKPRVRVCVYTGLVQLSTQSGLSITCPDSRNGLRLRAEDTINTDAAFIAKQVMKELGL